MPKTHSQAPIQTVFVPQGPEYRAVRRGLQRCSNPPLIQAIPVGPVAVSRSLQSWLQQVQTLPEQQRPRNALVMGLCGSLRPRYRVGMPVIYTSCWEGSRATKHCDIDLTVWLQQVLQPTIPLVRSLTSDRLIWSAAEKQQLSQSTGKDVVDMEGYAALDVLSQAGIAVAMVRVVSDNCWQDLPNLTNALDAAGRLRSLPLAWGMLRQPIAATHLIQGSLRGLQVLQSLTTRCLAALA